LTGTITGKLPVLELALPFPVMVPLPEVGNPIHPDLPDFYVGFRWFIGQIVHFFGRQMNHWPFILIYWTSTWDFVGLLDK
jgi:hypothetical protein